MDIDEFLDREISGLNLPTDNAKKHETSEIIQPLDMEPASLFDSIKASISSGKLEEAEQLYIRLWHTLIEQKLQWNKELYEGLLSLSRQLITALNRSYNDVKSKADYIYGSIRKARAYLNEGKKDLPYRVYAEVQDILNSIPNSFFEEKRAVQEQILNFYQELKSRTDMELAKRVSRLSQEINLLIEKISSSIRINDSANAILSYNKCAQLYSQIPEGFLREKASLGIKLLEIYRSLSIYNEISNLQREMYQPTYQQQKQQLHKAQKKA
ncbi:hypothetical protein HYS31_06715 [Candidatus Woesearchaeota archaeon]|nr:hypothetical protein [Candidatus Woesearchaeota archaeon]